MRHIASALGWLVVVMAAVATVAAQHATDADIVAAVRAAIRQRRDPGNH
jgi:hypothetical protein